MILYSIVTTKEPEKGNIQFQAGTIFQRDLEILASENTNQPGSKVAVVVCGELDVERDPDPARVGYYISNKILVAQGTPLPLDQELHDYVVWQMDEFKNKN